MTERFNRSGREGVLHYVTINIRDRRKAFISAANALAACLELRRHCDEYPARLIAYVVMPEHLHLIVNPRDGDINRFLSQFKPAVTGRVAEIAIEQQNHRVQSWLYDAHLQRNRLWQDGKYNFHLYTERLIWQKINYIHTNPIARRLVKTAAEYPYSSFRAMYEIDDEIIIPIDRNFWWNEIGLDVIASAGLPPSSKQ
jgi:REP element-mobilizing transposase RayT